jgi:hypothetical protein
MLLREGDNRLQEQTILTLIRICDRMRAGVIEIIWIAKVVPVGVEKKSSVGRLTVIRYFPSFSDTGAFAGRGSTPKTE